MERGGHLPGGVISEVKNLYSQNTYMVSTAPEIGEDYWTTALMPLVEKRRLFGLIKQVIPDFYHPIATWTRNRKEDAYQAHAQVRHIVISIKEEDWFDEFPRPAPVDGYSEGAKARLVRALGVDADAVGMTDEAAERLVDEFASLMGQHSEFILDADLLPDTKERIYQAFRQVIRSYEWLKENDRARFKEEGLERTLDTIQSLELSVADFQRIDAEDREFVSRLNTGPNLKELADRSKKEEIPSQEKAATAEYIEAAGKLFYKYFKRGLSEREKEFGLPSSNEK